MSNLDSLKPYAKAFTAAVVAGASFAIPVVDDGLIVSEILGIAVAGLTAFGTVWAIPNKDPKKFDPSKPVTGYGSGV